MRKKSTLCYISIAFLIIAVFTTLSCERDTFISNPIEDPPQVQVDGILNFDSFEEFSQTAAMLNALSFPELEKWCFENSFISQEYLFQKLIQEEEKYEEGIIKQYGENVSTEYLTSELNLPEHPNLYFELLSKGVIYRGG